MFTKEIKGEFLMEKAKVLNFKISQCVNGYTVNVNPHKYPEDRDFTLDIYVFKTIMEVDDFISDKICNHLD